MVSLTVLVEPEEPRIVQGVEMEVMAGKEVVLECQTEGRPEPEISWYRKEGDTSLQHGDTLLGRQRTSLQQSGKIFSASSVVTIIPTGDQLLQTITCSTINSASTQVKTTSIILRLIYKPVVSLVQTSKRMQEGDTVSFTCGLNAWPPVTGITWFIGGREMIDHVGDVFSIDKISQEMQGVEVKCMAKNKVGVGEDKTELNIICEYDLLSL